MAEPNKRLIQAQQLQQYLTPIGAAPKWTGDRKTLAAFASWVYKVRDHPNLGAGTKPCAGFVDFTDGMPPPPRGAGNSYDGAAFLHPTSSTLIITSRGSETLEDWITNAVAALDICWKQIGPAVQLAADAVVASRRVLGGDVARLLVCGNSLGGACAEAQAALLNAELKKRGEAAVNDISGFCDGSAGFATIIKKYGNETYPGIAAANFNLKNTITHLIRDNDPILAQHDILNGDTLGKIDDNIASIYSVNFVTRKPAGPNGIRRRRWELEADAANHSDFYYFHFIDVPKTHHVVKPKSKDMFWEPGEAPAKTVFKLDELPPKYA